MTPTELLPTIEQMDTAIAWLRSNEGTECKAAADYLEALCKRMKTHEVGLRLIKEKGIKP